MYDPAYRNDTKARETRSNEQLDKCLRKNKYNLQKTLDEWSGHVWKPWTVV